MLWCRAVCVFWMCEKIFKCVDVSVFKRANFSDKKKNHLWAMQCFIDTQKWKIIYNHCINIVTNSFIAEFIFFLIFKPVYIWLQSDISSTQNATDWRTYVWKRKISINVTPPHCIRVSNSTAPHNWILDQHIHDWFALFVRFAKRIWQVVIKTLSLSLMKDIVFQWSR